MRAKPCATWLSVGKILELPEPHNLCIFNSQTHPGIIKRRKSMKEKTQASAQEFVLKHYSIISDIV